MLCGGSFLKSVTDIRALLLKNIHKTNYQIPNNPEELIAIKEHFEIILDLELVGQKLSEVCSLI
jgi:hypothetical protein